MQKWPSLLDIDHERINTPISCANLFFVITVINFSSYKLKLMASFLNKKMGMRSKNLELDFIVISEFKDTMKVLKELWYEIGISEEGVCCNKSTCK